VPLGIGIERIGQYIRSQLPDATTFVVSSDTARTPKQSQKIVDTFYATRGGILVGTEMALPYLSEKIDCAAMSSIDSLLCVPNFQIEEKIFGIIATLRECVKRELILETSNPENAMLKHAKSGTISKYANEELALRKKLHYPPYTNLIKVTSCGSRNTVIEDMRTFVKRVEKYTPRVFSGFISEKRGPCLHALIRVPSNAWPDEDLIKIFRGLPATFEVHVDPNRTL
jgi:primosomal protein N'